MNTDLVEIENFCPYLSQCLLCGSPRCNVGIFQIRFSFIWFWKRFTVNFAICISHPGDEDLEIGKVYRVLPDAKAVEVGCLRVIDESGEDYLYPANWFMVLDLPKATRERLLAVLEADAA